MHNFEDPSQRFRLAFLSQSPKDRAYSPQENYGPGSCFGETPRRYNMPEIKWNVCIPWLSLWIAKIYQCRFLLAQLQIDSLVHQTSARNVYKALKHLPEKLNDTYHDALRRIRGQPPEHSTLAEQVISWIFYAKRPLKLAELREALAVEPGDVELERSGLHEPELLLKVCCGLVAIEGKHGFITLVHYTLQQFLLACWEKQCPNMELKIAATCLTYMCFAEFSTALRNEEQVRDREKKYQFLGYTSGNWAGHVGNGLEKDLEAPLLQFLKNDNCLHNVVCVNQLQNGATFEKPPNKTLPLHFTASWGLAHTMGILIREGANIEARAYAGLSPLYLAAQNGRHEAALLLLDSGADVDSFGWATPLTAALRSENTLTFPERYRNVARLLLERGANVNIRDRADGYPPIFWATRRGDQSMVKLLLQHGADPNRIDRGGLTPLNWAVTHRNLQLVETLTAARQETDTREARASIQADPNLVSSVFPTSPLHCAVDLFWEEGIETLIKSGADPHCLDIYGRSSLDYAWPFENLLSRLGYNPTTFVPTSTSLHNRRLAISITSLIDTILQKNAHDYLWTCWTNCYRLGKCLLQKCDAEEARTAFEQTIENTNTCLLPSHCADCDGCGHESILGSRFTCYACPNIDLCGDCMGKYPFEAPNPRCRDHDFLELPGPDWYHLKERENEHLERVLVNMRGETLDEWLERLKLKYSP